MPKRGRWTMNRIATEGRGSQRHHHVQLCFSVGAVESGEHVGPEYVIFNVMVPARAGEGDDSTSDHDLLVDAWNRASPWITDMLDNQPFSR